MTAQISNPTEIVQGVIFYDATCGLCAGGAGRLNERLARQGFRLTPLQSEEAARLTGATEDALREEMYLVTKDGTVLRGVDALLFASTGIWWAGPLRLLAKVPGMKPLMRVAYRWVARHRHRISACVTRRD